MHDVDKLNGLIDRIYEAAVHPEGWSSVIEGLCGALDADSGALYVYNSTATQGALAAHYGVPPEVIAGYESWTPRNPHMQALAPRMVAGNICVNSPVSRQAYLQTDYFNDFLRLHHPLYAATGCCMFDSPTINAVISLDRHLSRPEFDSSVAGTWKVLMGHLQRATYVSMKVRELDLERSAALAAIEKLNFGVVFLSPGGTVMTMNEAARRILDSKASIALDKRGRLSCANSKETARLDALVDSACSPTPSPAACGGGWLLAGQGEEESAVQMFVSPLRLGAYLSAPERPSAVVFLQEPGGEPTPVARLQQLFALTLAEARVAQALALGTSVQEISDRSEVSVATVRTHVRRLFSKVGARTISDLTRRLASILPVR